MLLEKGGWAGKWLSVSGYLLCEHEVPSSSLQCHTKPDVATGLPVTPALCVCVRWGCRAKPDVATGLPVTPALCVCVGWGGGDKIAGDTHIHN